MPRNHSQSTMIMPVAQVRSHVVAAFAAYFVRPAMYSLAGFETMLRPPRGLLNT